MKTNTITTTPWTGLTRASLVAILALIWTGLVSGAPAPPLIEWQVSLGGGGYDSADGVVQTPDGGYLVAGSSASGVSGNKSTPNYGGRDYWVVRLDMNDGKVWERVFGGSSDEDFTCISSAGDGGCLVGGASSSGVSGNKSVPGFGSFDYYVVRLDANGTKLWERVFGGSGYDYLMSIQPTADGGWLLAGHSSSGTSGNKLSASFGAADYWVVKVDANGQKVGEWTFGGSSTDQLTSLEPSLDGGWVMGGYSWSGVSGNKQTPALGGADFWLVKMDATGAKVWDRVFGGNSDDVTAPGTLKLGADGGWLVGGRSLSGVSGNKTTPSYGSFDSWVVRLDANGNKLWERADGGSGQDHLAEIQPVSDGGWLLAAYSASGVSGNKTTPSFGGWDSWLIKLADDGSEEWEAGYGGSGDDYQTSLLMTSDGGGVLAGYSTSSFSGNKTSPQFGGGDYWVVKLAPFVALNQPPVARSKDVTLFTGPGATTCALPASIDDGSFDPDGTAITLTQDPPGPYPVGATLVLLTAVDSEGASSSAQATVTVIDDTPPVLLTRPPDRAAEAGPNCVAPVPDLRSEVVATDNCTPASQLNKTQSPLPGTLLGLGTNTVRIAVSDTAGNLAYCYVRFTVVDTTPPVIVTPGNLLVGTDPGRCNAVVHFAVTATDNCRPVVVTSTPGSGSVFPHGTTLVTCETTDPSGNRAVSTFTVSVVDREAPVADCVPTAGPSGNPKAGNKPASDQNRDGFYRLTGSDNCDGAAFSIYIKDSASSFIAGPFHPGEMIKITQAPGVMPNQKPMAGGMATHIQLKGDALVYGVDSSGNASVPHPCLAPPPSK